MIWELGKVESNVVAKVIENRFPLREGPQSPSGDYKEFLETFLLPAYSAAEGMEEEQVDGEDPLMEVEAIVGKQGKGKKIKYHVKWKGSEIKTWEPKSHLIKYGSSKLVADYENKSKVKKV